jgi:hypothetical protein
MTKGGVTASHGIVANKGRAFSLACIFRAPLASVRAAMTAPSTWVFFSVRMSTELLPMMLVCPFTQAEEDEPEPEQFARWFFSLFSFQRTKRPGGAGPKDYCIPPRGAEAGEC